MRSSSSHPPRTSDGFFPAELAAIEGAVAPLPGHYFGEAPAALYTSKEDYLRLMTTLPDLGTWVELGAGLGLGCALYGELFPERMAIGVEFDLARITWARENCAASNVRFVHGDLLREPIPAGDTYFCYFPTGPALDHVLFQLGERPTPFTLIAIESHGDFFPRLAREAWLELVQEVPLASKRHHPMARIYRPLRRRSSSFFDLSFQERMLLLSSASGTWLGESFGMEWLRDDEFQLLHPPRTIRGHQVLKQWGWEDLDPIVAFLTAMRRGGECEIQTTQTTVRGALRKILPAPVIGVELSGGEQLKWEDIRTIRQEQLLCYASSSSHFSLPPAVWVSLTPAARGSMPTTLKVTTAPTN